MAKNIDFMGAVYSDVPSVRLPQQGGGLVGFDDTTDATATAEDIAQGKTAYVNGEKVTGTGTGSTPVINPLSVTENGTYTAPSGVDGYSPVVVNVSGGGGGQEDEIVEGSISGTYTNTGAMAVKEYLFANNLSLTAVNFTAALRIGSSAFSNCTNLLTVNFPSVSNIAPYAFSSCSMLNSIYFPETKVVNASAFRACIGLTSASFPAASRIGSAAFALCNHLERATIGSAETIFPYAFSGCTRLIELNLGQVSSVPTLSNSNVFSSTPIGGYSATAGQYGSIYVPASLYSAFQSATNWQYFSNRMVSV